MKFNKSVKIQNQGAAVITLPKGIRQILDLNYGDTIDLTVDFKNNCFIASKQGECKNNTLDKLEQLQQTLPEKVQYIKNSANDILDRLRNGQDVDKTELIDVLEILSEIQ